MTGIPRIDYKDLILTKKLGEGSFGEVHLGKAKTGILQRTSKLAVKILKETSVEAEKDFKKELEIFVKVGSHKNVVKMLGYCAGPPCIIMEYITTVLNGQEISGLWKYLWYLKNNARNNLNYRELETFALQIAQGMEHLEKKKIVHRDLAARNVLIDGSKNLKISDFGLSRVGVYMSQSGIFAFRWVSPEALKDWIFTNKSDVWSFGVVLWEIATLGKTPYPELNDHEVQRFIRSGKHLDKPDIVTPELYNIMLKCWAPQANNRPTFTDLVQSLTDLQSKNSYFLPNQRLNKQPKDVLIQEKSAADHRVHPAIVCNVCLGSIFGTRYKCSECKDYDLCQNCKDKGHHKRHSFQEILRPGMLNSAIIHPGVTCDVCKRPVIGFRYNCSVCSNYDLCQTCKSAKHHNHHLFSTILCFSLSGGKVHPRITCDVCKGSILGIRYKCSVCPNYDLCSNCKFCNFHKEHKFLKILDPENFGTVVHPRVTCDACKGSVSGTRYKCSACLNYDLCQDCKRMGHHNHHSFYTIGYPSLSLGFGHPGIICDGCRGSILGIRYKCTSCPNYDLCPTCKAKGNHKHHQFQPIFHPIMKPGMPHLAVTCDICRNSIVGVRYKCIVCKDYDLCQACKKAGHHKNHEFYSFK